MSLSERLKNALATSRLYPRDTALILEAIPVLEAAESWYRAHTVEAVAAPTPQQAYEESVAEDHGRDAADQALLAALAAHGPSQEKEMR